MYDIKKYIKKKKQQNIFFINSVLICIIYLKENSIFAQKFV